MSEVTEARIERKGLFPLTHYEYGEAYFGSFRGMRYRIAADPLKNFHYTPEAERGELFLRFSVWPEPMSYAATPAEEVISQTFPFTEEGFTDGVEWLNERYRNVYT